MQKFVGQQKNNGWFRAKIKKSFFRPSPFSEEDVGTLRCQAGPTRPVHRVCPSQQNRLISLISWPLMTNSELAGKNKK